MTKEELKEKFHAAFMEGIKEVQLLSYMDSFTSRIAYAMMIMTNKTLIASTYRCNLGIEKNIITSGERVRGLIPASEKESAMDEKIKRIVYDVDMFATLDKILKYFDDNNIVYFVYRHFYEHYVIMEDMVLGLNNEDGRVTFYFISETGETPSWFEEQLVYKEEKSRDSYGYVVRGSHGFTTKELKINDIKVDIDLNYNDDFPDKEIKDFLNSDKSGVVIFHGEPGTGKSTYIRHLIENVDKKFLYLDASCFDYLTDASFIELLFDNKDSVIVLEDSEKLLKKRNSREINNHISSLLNLTDGLLADSMKLKMVCTFNAPLEDIDDAILRKGRLKVKYQFNKLNRDKTAKLFESLGVHSAEDKEQTLADIYNYAEKVDFSEKKRKSIGF